MADDEKNENERPAPEEAVEETPAAEQAAEVEETAAEAPVADEPAADAPVAEEEAPDKESAEKEPVAEAEPAAAEPAAAAEPEAEPVPAPQSQPKKKHKRLPRALRPKKGRRRHVPATERKATSREPKPEHERGRRQERRGVVVSDAMDKTIVVKVDTIRSHPRYKKVIRRSTKFHAHDEQNSAKVGDVVRIVESRPLSATKNWRLVEIVEAAK